MPPAANCADLYSGGVTTDGDYSFQGGPFATLDSVSCRMSEGGGGFMRLRSNVVALLPSGIKSEILYTSSNGWVRTPPTGCVFSWGSNCYQTGTWYYGSRNSHSSSSYHCGGGEGGHNWGASCSSGGGNSLKFGAVNGVDAGAGYGGAWQDQPRNCRREGVVAWWRPYSA